MTETRALLEITDLVKHYPVRSGVLRRAAGTVHAVDGVSFSLGIGETLGLVGESGCGKSTVARSVLRLVEPTGGSIRLDGQDITHLSKTELRPHRRAVVAHISHSVAVMYLRRIVQSADKTALFKNPRHPYTQALLASVPVADPRSKRLKPLVDGDVPSPVNPPSGCAFHTRCRYAMPRCKTERPALRDAGPRHQVACLLNDGTGRAGDVA